MPPSVHTRDKISISPDVSEKVTALTYLPCVPRNYINKGEYHIEHNFYELYLSGRTVDHVSLPAHDLFIQLVCASSGYTYYLLSQYGGKVVWILRDTPSRVRESIKIAAKIGEELRLELVKALAS